MEDKKVCINVCFSDNLYNDLKTFFVNQFKNYVFDFEKVSTDVYIKLFTKKIISLKDTLFEPKFSFNMEYINECGLFRLRDLYCSLTGIYFDFNYLNNH